VSPFGFGLGTTHFKGDTLFFSSLKIHTIDFTLPKVLPVAQAFQPVQTAWRAGTPAPPTFSCFTGEPKAHEELFR
jgi:hypothetical protein